MNKAKEKWLLLQIQLNKDQTAFSQVYNELVDPIYRFIYLKVSNAEIAQDLTSEVFLKAWKSLTKGNNSEIRYLKAYFYSTARNITIDYYRKGRKDKELPLNTSVDFASSQDVAKSAQIAIDHERILKIVKTLKESYREIILLYHVDQLKLKEISVIIDKSPVATRVLLHRANQALKREYEKTLKTN